MLATLLSLSLALVGQPSGNVPVEPTGPPAWGWTVPKDGKAPAGWYRVRRDAVGKYHVFARDQPSGKIEPFKPPHAGAPATANYGLDLSHRHPLCPSAGEVRGTDKELGRELSESLLHAAGVKPIAAKPAAVRPIEAKSSPDAPCPGPGPCPSPRRPEPRPLPLPAIPAVPNLNFLPLFLAGVLLVLTAFLGFIGLLAVLLLRAQK
jgi:hypothetical protein